MITQLAQELDWFIIRRGRVNVNCEEGGKVMTKEGQIIRYLRKVFKLENISNKFQ